MGQTDMVNFDSIRSAAVRGGVQRRRSLRSGQTLLFLVLVLVVLFFVVLWNFDLHKLIYVKSVSRNAGDAAALAAARWQGVALNLIGDLNIMHALAIVTGNPEGAEAIMNVQARLCFVGPMIALMAAQQAAKNNGIHQNDDFTAMLREHADAVRHDYPARTGPDGEMLFPEPYPGCWEEYADMLDLIADDGVAAGPDNARYYSDYSGGHYLLMPDFYEAIAGRNWCWFYEHAPHLLEEYRNFFPCWWPPLPEIRHMYHMNSEFFGLGLTKQVCSLAQQVPWSVFSGIATDRGFDVFPQTGTTFAVWYAYNTNVWTTWDAMALTGKDPFPATGPVKPQYDYAGADAAVRVEAQARRVTPGSGGRSSQRTITWTAAAKPFGFLGMSERPNAFGLVLPAFRDVRLIPIDASSAPAGGTYDLEWRRHIEKHLPDYMANGPRDYPCWYCRQLVVWEDPLFRQEGVEWLSKNSALCKLGGGSGGRDGGGRRRGH